MFAREFNLIFMKKFLAVFLGFIVLIGIFSGCSLFKKEVKDFKPESFLSAKSVFVYSLDRTDPAQVANLTSLKEKFPYLQDISSFFESKYKEKGMSDVVPFKDLSDALSGISRMAIAIEPSKDEEGKDAFSFIVAIKHSDLIGFESILDKGLLDQNQFLIENDGDVKYWVNDKDNAYFAKIDDNFLIGQSKNQLKNAIKIAENGDGFSEESFVKKDLAELGLPNIGYIFVDQIGFAKFGNSTSGSGASNVFSVVSSFNPTEQEIVSFFADAEGVRSAAKMYLSDEGKKKTYSDQLSLIKKVPTGKPMLYIEAYPLYDLFANLQSAAEKDSSKTDIFVQMASGVGVDKESFVKFLNSPFTISISDNGNVVPNIMIYVNVLDVDPEIATKIGKSLSGYAQDFVDQFTANLEIEGSIKKDVVLMDGRAVDKFYIDWASVPQKKMNEFDAAYKAFLGPKNELKDAKFELYSGVTGDGVLALGFYPDFDKEYKKNLLTDDQTFSEAQKKTGDYYGAGLIYLSLKNIGDFAGNILVSIKGSRALSPDIYVMADKIINFLSTVKYLILSDKKDGDFIYGSLYMGLEKIEGIEDESVVESGSGSVSGSGSAVEKVEKPKLKR